MLQIILCLTVCIGINDIRCMNTSSPHVPQPSVDTPPPDVPQPPTDPEQQELQKWYYDFLSSEFHKDEKVQKLLFIVNQKQYELERLRKILNESEPDQYRYIEEGFIYLCEEIEEVIDKIKERKEWLAGQWNEWCTSVFGAENCTLAYGPGPLHNVTGPPADSSSSSSAEDSESLSIELDSHMLESGSLESQHHSTEVGDEAHSQHHSTEVGGEAHSHEVVDKGGVVASPGAHSQSLHTLGLGRSARNQFMSSHRRPLRHKVHLSRSIVDARLFNWNMLRPYDSLRHRLQHKYRKGEHKFGVLGGGARPERVQWSKHPNYPPPFMRGFPHSHSPMRPSINVFRR